MDGTSSSTETPTQVGQIESDTEQPNPFAAIIDNNQNGVDVADSSRGPHENLDQRALENQMKAIIEMQKARENIASVHESQEKAGGEAIVGGTPHEESTIMNATELMSGMSEDEKNTFLTTPERIAEIKSVAAAADPLAMPNKVISEKKSIFASIVNGVKNIITAPARAISKVKETISSAWNWTKAEVNALADKITSLLPKSTKQSESNSSSASTSSPPPATSLNSPPLSA